MRRGVAPRRGRQAEPSTRRPLTAVVAAAVGVVAAATVVGSRASTPFVPLLARRAAWTAALGLAAPAASHGFDWLPRPPMADKRGLDEIDASKKKFFIKDRDSPEGRVAVQVLTQLYSRVQLALLKIEAQYDVNINDDFALPFKNQKFSLTSDVNPIIVDVKRAGGDIASLTADPTKGDVQRVTTIAAMAFYEIIRNPGLRSEPAGTEKWATQEIIRSSVQAQESLQGSMKYFLAAVEKLLAFVDIKPPEPPAVPGS